MLYDFELFRPSTYNYTRRPYYTTYTVSFILMELKSLRFEINGFRNKCTYIFMCHLQIITSQVGLWVWSRSVIYNFCLQSNFLQHIPFRKDVLS